MARRNRPCFTGTPDLSGRDEQANAEVAAILAELPADHAARTAFAQGKCTIALTHLLADRKDLNSRLMDSYWARHDRIWDNYRGTAPGGVDGPYRERRQ